MELALIPPFSYLKDTFKTNYQLMLPHLLYNEEYEAVYAHHCGAPNQFVILDNGAAEGEQPSIEELLGLATIFDPDELVIPDVIGDKSATIALAEELESVACEYGVLENCNYMFVLQGQTFDEVLDCARWVQTQEWISTVGIPRHLITTLSDKSARIAVANAIQIFDDWSKKIHFLGANPINTAEAIALADSQFTIQDFVRGMDTSMPYNYAHAGLYITSQAVTKRPENYFELPYEAFDKEVLEHNIKALEDAVAGELV